LPALAIEYHERLKDVASHIFGGPIRNLISVPSRASE